MSDDPLGQFDDEFEKEWLAGRSGAIYEELHKRFRDLCKRRTHRRVQELLRAQEQLGHGGEDPLLRVTTANAQAMAENALLAVAIYLAEHEPPPS